MDRKGILEVAGFVGILILALCSENIGAAPVGTGNIIVAVKIAGNRSISSDMILTRVRSRAGQAFEAEVAAEDARRIAALTGVEYCYYSTKVVGNKIELTFVVVEKNLVRSISFVGNKKLKDKKLLGKTGLRAGDYLDPVQADAGAKEIAELYRRKGYSAVSVELDREKLAEGKVVYTIDEGPRTKITSVKFSGNESIKTGALKRVIKTKTSRFLVLPAYYNEEKPQRDALNVQKIYYQRGFLNCKVKIKEEFNDSRNKVRITFEIAEGSAYTVDKIMTTGNTYFDEQTLRSELKLEEGKTYNQRKAEFDVKRLLKVHREIGFVEAKVELRRTFVAGNRVEVDYAITEGERFRIGQVNVSGNQETQDKVIRQILSEYDFLPGNWYNADIARGDGSGYLEKLIRRGAVTEGATITPSGQTPGQRDAQVNIIEGQTGMVMIGGGLASDSGAFAQFVFSQQNFNIKDKPKSFKDLITGQAFKGAGQKFRIALQPGTEVDIFSVSFTEPYYKKKPISLDVGGSSYERMQESYNEERLRGYFGFEKREKNKWRKSIGFRVENVDVTDLDFDAPKEVVDDEGSSAIVGVKLGIGRDLTDDRYNPSKGQNYQISYEQVGGEYTFGILSAVHRHYKTLYEDLSEQRTILSTKLLAATVVGDTPVFEKLYGGGMGYYGIRGFEYRGVSPRGLQQNVANPERKDPIGSDWIFLANTEVTVPITSEDFAALFFVDSGTVDTGNYRASVGIGIQIQLPQWFGPVPMRFAIATPFLKDDEDDTEAFSFSLGRLF